MKKELQTFNLVLCWTSSQLKVCENRSVVLLQNEQILLVFSPFKIASKTIRKGEKLAFDVVLNENIRNIRTHWK